MKVANDLILQNGLYISYRTHWHVVLHKAQGWLHTKLFLAITCVTYQCNSFTVVLYELPSSCCNVIVVTLLLFLFLFL